MNLSVNLVLLMLVATGSASQSLLNALFDYNDPLQLDEHKSKRVAESYAKGKASKGSNKDNFFSQFNYDLGDDDQFKDTGKDHGADIEDAEQVNQNARDKDIDYYDDDDDSYQQHATAAPAAHISKEQEQTSNNKDCPDDLPTYRMYSVLSGCGVPIDQEVVKPSGGNVKLELDDGDKDNQVNLAHYVSQIGKDKGIVQTGGFSYYNQENKNTRGQMTDNSDRHKDDSDEVYEPPFIQTSGNDRILGQEGQVQGQHNVQTSGQTAGQGWHKDDSDEVYEPPFIQTSGNDRILGQEGQVQGQHNVQTSGQTIGQGQHKDDSDEDILGQQFGLSGEFDYDQILDYDQTSGQYAGQISGQSGHDAEQIGQHRQGQVQTSGQYDQNNQQSGRLEQAGQSGQVGQVGQVGQIGQTGQSGQVGQLGQTGQIGQVGQVGQIGQGGQTGQVSQVGQVGQTGQVGQHGQVSIGGNDDFEEFEDTEHFWESSDESKEFNQVSGSDYSQTGSQVSGQQQVRGPELPEKLHQQTGNDGSYNLRTQSGNDDGTPRRVGGDGGAWVSSQQQGSRYGNYHIPANAPRPSHVSSGTAGVGTSYTGRGPTVNIPNPNQIGGGGQFSCLGKSEGYYVDYASDCRRFYRCAHGDHRVFEFQCGGGTKFDINTSQCGHSHEVHCRPGYNM